MKLIRTAEQLTRRISAIKTRNRSIGFVPTMGALHDGHLSLIAAARRQSDIVAVSIFVNPTQFGPGEDYRQYPRNLRRDAKVCKNAGVDLLFAPSVRGLYPNGTASSVEVGPLGTRLEGATRPGHFNGVATIVIKLLDLVRPDQLYLGQKDYQQILVIKELIRDFQLHVKVTVCPTIREADGLALSSRNRYLSRRQRQAAPLLYRALCTGRRRIRQGERSVRCVRAAMQRVLARSPIIRTDYLVIGHPKTLEAVKEIRGRCIVAVAATIGQTRLIDHLIVVPH